MTDLKTTHYGINLPVPADSMADILDGFNNAWPLISGAPKPVGVVAGPSNPTIGYTVGQVVYNQAWKSAFILIATDANWGYFWRPLQAKWGPWVSPGTAIISDTTDYGMATEGPVCFRISNTNQIEFTGGFKRISSPNTLPNGFITSPLTSMPVGARPDKIWQTTLVMHKSGMGNNNGNYYLKAWVTNTGGTWNCNIFNNATGTADADTVFLNGFSYQIADRTDL